MSDESIDRARAAPPGAAPQEKRRLSRRGFVVGAAAGVVAGGLEWTSLRGRFDHRREPAGDGVAHAGAKERFAASLRATEAGASGVVHVGHSTHLLALGGMRLLTDPWFYDPAFGALSHDVAPAVPPSELGPLDAILVTHDHADHADLRAMDEMDKRATVIVATSDLAARARARGFADVSVLAPWEERALGAVSVTAVPGLHDIYEIGFVVRAGDKSVYFAGDTRLHPDLAAIAERFRPDASILPVDGTRLTGAPLHVMTPEDAGVAARTLGSRLVIPSHAEAYFSDPVAGHLLASTVPRARQRFAEVMQKELPGVACRVPEPGELVAL
ncbi:MAG: MBL fold metallo-hydrolase [Labilithrix sp.]|nr:MBL fold metallo-hydrolase [Labilithrix sp.]